MCRLNKYYILPDGSESNKQTEEVPTADQLSEYASCYQLCLDA